MAFNDMLGGGRAILAYGYFEHETYFKTCYHQMNNYNDANVRFSLIVGKSWKRIRLDILVYYMMGKFIKCQTNPMKMNLECFIIPKDYVGAHSNEYTRDSRHVYAYATSAVKMRNQW